MLKHGLCLRGTWFYFDIPTATVYGGEKACVRQKRSRPGVDIDRRGRDAAALTDTQDAPATERKAVDPPKARSGRRARRSDARNRPLATDDDVRRRLGDLVVALWPTTRRRRIGWESLGSSSVSGVKKVVEAQFYRNEKDLERS